jgi:NhaP-type Na+/H+ and K+/H+ antiporter
MFAKKYHQLRTTKTDSIKFLKGMHIVMIVLCLFATLALFSNPSTLSKILLSLIILAYTVAIFINPRAIRSLFQVST